MSARIPLSEHRKELSKYRMDKENVYTVVQNGKSSDGKNDSGKKKGLSVNAENRAIRTTSVQNLSVSKPQFQIYFDDNDENNRSRPRVRKNVCRKEIRARRNVETLEKTIISTKVKETNRFDSITVPRRARSSSNCRQGVPLNDKTIEMNDKPFHNRRCYSESRRQVQSSDVRKIKHLTDDVKKRTFSSIQMWKDKMRKPYTGTVPKNVTANVLNADKTHVKIKLRKISHTGSMDLRPEVSQNQVTNANNATNKNVEEPSDSMKDVIRYLSNEVVAILQDTKYFNTQTDTNMSTFSSENIPCDNLISTTTMASSVTPLDSRFFLPLTPMKVRYEKRGMMKKPLNKPLNKKEHGLDITCETPYERDYLDDVLNTEREREDNAPRLSSRFLRENINAEQRRLIVGYIIRLGVHCYYSSSVIYQTVKLFNVAVDRILVEMDNIQLMALACLWIILKREAPGDKIPSATVILQLAKDLYTAQEKHLLMYEKKILTAVKFNTRFADPFSLLSYYILNVNRDSHCNIIRPNDIMPIYFCGSYMIDSSMLDESLCDIPTYVIAIAAVELSLCFVYSSDMDQTINVDKTWCQVWRSKQSLTEWEERVMNSTKQIMIRHALENDKFSSNIIYKKYMRSRHGKITHFLHGKLTKVNLI